jgi:hypothetical protein
VRPFGQLRKMWMMRFGKSVIARSKLRASIPVVNCADVKVPCCECRGWPRDCVRGLSCSIPYIIRGQSNGRAAAIFAHDRLAHFIPPTIRSRKRRAREVLDSIRTVGPLARHQSCNRIRAARRA